MKKHSFACLLLLLSACGASPADDSGSASAELISTSSSIGCGTSCGGGYNAGTWQLNQAGFVTGYEVLAIDANAVWHEDRYLSKGQGSIPAFRAPSSVNSDVVTDYNYSSSSTSTPPSGVPTDFVHERWTRKQ